MNWLKESVSDSRTGKVSVKRVTMLVATVALAASVVILSVAGLIGREVAAAIGAVAVPLAGLGGYSYVHGKIAESKRDGSP